MPATLAAWQLPQPHVPEWRVTHTLGLASRWEEIAQMGCAPLRRAGGEQKAGLDEESGVVLDDRGDEADRANVALQGATNWMADEPEPCAQEYHISGRTTACRKLVTSYSKPYINPCATLSTSPELQVVEFTKARATWTHLTRKSGV